MDVDDTYCEPPERTASARPAGTAEVPPYAECVLCREPTEYPESTKGATLCPVCAWQEAGRTACSG
ncbi:hypothetical protein [Streptomyces sp. CS131]|uniref:hypothetical protein n=1 Tax=Streptomyces sp. CS131 TaxID=2162711 RepID=UPI000D516B33|nr:hypothetical protein [Streptomyces sp. CS131]PVC79463.1 hypothetical protein DBP20_29060 [Streptomyces sp. CS131]